MQDRQHKILKLYELMEELAEEHDANGTLRSVDETTAEIALQFDIPKGEMK